METITEGETAPTLPAWQFTLNAPDGREFPTRPPTRAELVLIQSIGECGANFASTWLLTRLCAGPELPDLSGCNLAWLVSVTAAYHAYFLHRSRAADYEQAAIAFTTMLGSGEKAQALLSDLSDFAAMTPFGSPELIAAARQLLAFGFAAEDVVPTMRMIGGVSAGPGVPVGNMAHLFGTSAAQGRLFMADINQFSTRGVPVIAELAKVLGVAETRVRATWRRRAGSTSDTSSKSLPTSPGTAGASPG
jgi:hypothetical protein